MKTKVRNLIKNPRYKLLLIGDEHYLMDMGKPFWKVIFPFFFWIFSNSIYKVNDEETIKKSKAPLSERQTFSQSLHYRGLGFILSNALSSTLNLLELSIPFWVNIIILTVALVSVVLLFIAFNQTHQDKLHQTV